MRGLLLWLGIIHEHAFIYRRDETGKMGVECLTCHKKIPLPWATYHVPVPSVAELERMVR